MLSNPESRTDKNLVEKQCSINTIIRTFSQDNFESVVPTSLSSRGASIEFGTNEEHYSITTRHWDGFQVGACIHANKVMNLDASDWSVGDVWEHNTRAMDGYTSDLQVSKTGYNNYIKDSQFMKTSMTDKGESLVIDAGGEKIKIPIDAVKNLYAAVLKQQALEQAKQAEARGLHKDDLSLDLSQSQELARLLAELQGEELEL